MKRWYIILTATVFAFALALAPGNGEANGAGKTVLIRADRTIETGLQRFIERAFAEAEARGAETVILLIDTFGGRVDAATAIGETVRMSPLRTVAYVERKAISAGSYIALNADEIYMHEGSTIGAAAVVDTAGERVRDSKIVSVWVEQMRSAALLNNRNPDIAEGMVDDSVKVEMPEIGAVSEPGNLITLTAPEAKTVGYAEGVVASMDMLLEAIGAESFEEIRPTPAEEAARVLTHPVTATLLFVLGIAGLGIELLVPGFGIPGIVGVASFSLYFLGNYIAGFAGVEHLVMFIAGVVLMLLELFIPSFGILGILGTVALISGVVLAAYDTGNALASLGIATLIAAVIVAIFIRYFKHRGIWNKFILRDSLKTEQGYVSHEQRKELIGKTGTAVTPLRPSGTILLENERIDVVTEGEFIPVGNTVEIVRMEGIRVIVRETASSNKG